MYRTTPIGITPPAPGLEREEPELRREEDIPADDGKSRPERPQAEGSRERGKLERE